MPRRPRRQHSPEQKTTLVQRHLVEKVPVSQICNENDLQPSLFYDWLRQFQAQAVAAFKPLTAATSQRGESGPRARSGRCSRRTRRSLRRTRGSRPADPPATAPPARAARATAAAALR